MQVHIPVIVPAHIYMGTHMNMYTQHTKFYFSLMSIYMYMCIYMCLHAHECRRKTSDLAQLQLRVVVSHSRRVLGVELGAFSEKTASALKCWAVSPVP